MPPIQNSYSIPGTRLHAGEYPGAKWQQDATKRIAQFLDAGVDTFIDLTEVRDGLAPYGPILEMLASTRDVKRLHFPIRDVGVTNELGMRRTLDAIDEALAEGRTVYVHCWGGVGRTGTVIGCWLVRHGAQPSDALDTVNRYFRSMPAEKTSKHVNGSPETREQRQFVIDWADVERRSRDVVPSLPSRVKGSLLGGAVGDALGASVEFMSWDRIRAKFGEQGIVDYAPAYGRIGAITDDTQMTLWTAEGVIRGMTRAHERGVGGPMSVIPRSYMRWLYTQDQSLPTHVPERHLILGGEDARAGWLFSIRELHHPRAPGNTCLAALRSPRESLWEPAPNDSKGCGGVMRVAPLAFITSASLDELFEEACRAAAVTHGHPSGILSAGALVWMLALLRDGAPLAEAVDDTIARVAREESSGETVDALKAARQLARSKQAATPAAVETLGGGWTGETALSIGTYAALVAGKDFDRAIRLAVNHSGDSDSTGSIAGQIVGVQVGIEGIVDGWLERLELREVIETVAEDLMKRPWAEEGWGERYPPY